MNKILTLKFKGVNMKKSKHSESEIIKAVKDLEGGISSEIICREHGISRGTLYHWRGKYGGMEVSQIKRLRELEEENGKLKRMYANLALDNEILREVIEKKL
ncbi:MAG TPA: transposase [Candidatus Egerieousia sp.]|nr:transposase [Candidatus Egerieousia sp.]